MPRKHKGDGVSFDIDQECRHAKERLRVSIEANTAYELKQMRKKYAGITWKPNPRPEDKLIWDQISQNLTQARQKLQWHGPQYGVYGFGALGNCFGV
jgi:hypothetical protein